MLSFSCFAQEEMDDCGMTYKESKETGFVCYQVREDGEIWVSEVFEDNTYNYYKSVIYKNEEELLSEMEIVYE